MDRHESFPGGVLPRGGEATASLRPVGGARRLGTMRVISALMLREMSTSASRTWGGYAWSILEPVAGIMLLTFIFSLAFREPPLGASFPIFYASGILPFFFYNSLQQKIATAIPFSRQLLSYPAVTFVDAIAARAIVAAVTETMVAFIVFGALLVLYETRTDPQALDMALSYVMAFTVALGIGTLNCYLFAVYPVWERIWGILNRPLFIISCIFFLYDGIGQPYRDWLWWNPLIHVIGQMRHGIYYGYDATYVSVAYVMGLGLGLLALGLGLLLGQHRSIINNR